MNTLLTARTLLPLVALALGACTSAPLQQIPNLGTGGQAAPAKPEGLPPWDNTSYWSGADNVEGAPMVKIDLRRQIAEFYKGDNLVGVSVASSGREGFNTPAGTFKITQKSPDHRSNLFGNYVDDTGKVVVADVDVRKDSKPPGTKFVGAPMPYFLRFNKGIGMHAGYLPGYPASHGCVRLPPKMARHFYDNVSNGTKVVVVN